MNDKERRRYFRIYETIGIAYQILEQKEGEQEHQETPDFLSLVRRQDEQIEQLLMEVRKENPIIAQLVTVFNQKLERIVNHVMVESQLVDKIAHRIKEANISACGLAFHNSDVITPGARLKLDLTLYPGELLIKTYGVIVACDAIEEDYYWRVDFYGMSEHAQELLIQHIVQRQSLQLKEKGQ